MTRRRLSLLSAVIAVFLLAGCGGSTKTASPGNAATVNPSTSSSTADGAPIDATCPTSNTIAFAKTKFVLHGGLAFGAFHRYLYKPYQAGAFASGQSGRIVALVKGGASALFIKREIRLMSEDVKANPALCNAIAAPLANVGNTISGAIDRLKGGDSSGLTAAETAITDIKGKAASSGNTITEDPNAPSS